MKKRDQENRDGRDTRLALRLRLQTLLFSGAVLGTSVLTLAGSDTKLPKSQGE